MCQRARRRPAFSPRALQRDWALSKDASARAWHPRPISSTVLCFRGLSHPNRGLLTTDPSHSKMCTDMLRRRHGRRLWARHARGLSAFHRGAAPAQHLASVGAWLSCRLLRQACARARLSEQCLAEIVCTRCLLVVRRSGHYICSSPAHGRFIGTPFVRASTPPCSQCGSPALRRRLRCLRASRHPQGAAQQQDIRTLLNF